MSEDIRKEIFGNIDKFVTIRISGKRFKVPEGEDLLRCLQYIAPYTIPYGDFCWNGDCRNCEIMIERDGSTLECLSCRTTVVHGDSIIEVSDEIKRQLEGVI